MFYLPRAAINEVAAEAGSPPLDELHYPRAAGIDDVERAKELLRQPALPLALIALRCGFADQSHFARVFSREAGVSPSQWRRGCS